MKIVRKKITKKKKYKNAMHSNDIIYEKKRNLAAAQIIFLNVTSIIYI